MGHNGTCHTSQDGNAVASLACTIVSSGAAHASVMGAFYEQLQRRRIVFSFSFGNRRAPFLFHRGCGADDNSIQIVPLHLPQSRVLTRA